MILIKNIEKFCQTIQDTIAEIGLNRVVITDEDYEKHVIEDVFLGKIAFIGVVPSSVPIGTDEDRTEFSETLNFYIVKKWKHNDGYIAFVDIVKETQQVTKQIIDILAKSHQECTEFDQMQQIRFQTLNVEPVSNYHDTVGYVLSFDIINVYI